MKKRGGTKWRKKIRYEFRKKSVAEIEYQNKKRKAELEEWIRKRSTDLSK